MNHIECGRCAWVHDAKSPIGPVTQLLWHDRLKHGRCAFHFVPVVNERCPVCEAERKVS